MELDPENVCCHISKRKANNVYDWICADLLQFRTTKNVRVVVAVVIIIVFHIVCCVRRCNSCTLLNCSVLTLKGRQLIFGNLH